MILQTNNLVWTIHGGTWQQLALGGVYRMDPMVAHGAVNWGPDPRIHPFIDRMAEGA